MRLARRSSAPSSLKADDMLIAVQRCVERLQGADVTDTNTINKILGILESLDVPVNVVQASGAVAAVGSLPKAYHASAMRLVVLWGCNVLIDEA